MKKELLFIVVFMLFIATFIPVSNHAFEFNFSSNENYINQPNSYNPAVPGDMSPPYPKFNIIDTSQKKSISPKILPQFKNNDIIDMIQSMDESLYLGYLEDLVDFGPRVTGTPECEAAGDYIYNEFQSMGLEVRYHNWSYGGYQDRNIEATLPGINETSDEIFIVCGHYDSVPGSPGADDDGSGTVTAIASAYIMSQYTFNHTVRFVTFSGEEQGLLGSHEYVEEAYNNGDNIVGTLNVDMIGYAITQTHGSQIKVYNNDASDWLYDFTESVSQQYFDYIDLITLDTGYTWGSDHNSFWEVGYDALFYHEYEFSPHWHQPSDTIENMNITYATKCSKLILATLAELAQSISLSDPPDAPTISGPASGIEGLEYDFTFVTTDPNDDEVFYFIDWGDGTNSGWIGPYLSDEEVIVSNTWFEHGIYDIKAKAKDTYGAGSEWSDPFTINIAEGPKLDIEPIVGGLFKVSTVIKNTGTIEATSVNWKINLNGGLILIGKETSDTILTIPAGGEQTINSGLILGLGRPMITVTAEIPTGSDIREQQALLLGFVIVVNPGGSL